MIPRLPLLLAGVLLLLAACSGSTGVDEPLASAAEATPPPTLAIPSDLPSVAEVPETDEPTSAEEPAVTQTDTEWGRIWDALPASFPVYPGAVRAGGGSLAVAPGVASNTDGSGSSMAVRPPHAATRTRRVVRSTGRTGFTCRG